MTTQEQPIPSHEDVTTAFARIRREGGVLWDVEHPQRRFELAAQRANVTRDLERLAAYRLASGTPPLGYYDHVLAELHRATKLVMAERASDHGDAPWTLVDGHDCAQLLGIKVGA